MKVPWPALSKGGGRRAFSLGFWNLRPQPATWEGGVQTPYALGLVVVSKTLWPLAALHSTAKPQVSSTAVSSFS